MSENTAYVAALQTSYFRMPTLAQVFLISKPGHFDRTTLGNNYTRSCADRWGGAVVSELRMGRSSCGVAVFTWLTRSQTALWPANLPCSSPFFKKVQIQSLLLIKAIKIKVFASSGRESKRELILTTFMERREVYHFTDGKCQV